MINYEQFKKLFSIRFHYFFQLNCNKLYPINVPKFFKIAETMSLHMKQFSYQKYYFLYLSFDTMYLSFTDVYLSFDNVYLSFNYVYLPFGCVYLSFNYVYFPFGCVDLPFNCVYFSLNYVLIIQLCPFIVHAIMPFYSSFNNGLLPFNYSISIQH